MLSGEVECLEEDLQAKQEQGTQALSGVARHQPVHLQIFIFVSFFSFGTGKFLSE